VDVRLLLMRRVNGFTSQKSFDLQTSVTEGAQILTERSILGTFVISIMDLVAKARSGNVVVGVRGAICRQSGIL